MEDIKEIVHIPATMQVAGQPAIIHGFLNREGCILPVVAVSRLFGENANEPGLYSPVILVSCNLATLGLLVDGVDEVVTIAEESLQPLDSTDSLNQCATDCFVTPVGTVSVLSTKRLLLAKERECIARLQAELERRLAETEVANS